MDYEQILERLAPEGAAIFAKTFGSSMAEKRTSERPLEPGFIAVDGRPPITFVTWYPNASDFKCNPTYEQLCRNFIDWRDRGDIESYRAAYDGWVESLPLIPFYRNDILPELAAVGVSPREIAWLRL